MFFVIPAKAGIQEHINCKLLDNSLPFLSGRPLGIQRATHFCPAFAGMTSGE